MGKIVITEFVSLDGVVEDPGGFTDFKHAGWGSAAAALFFTWSLDPGEEAEQSKLDETAARKRCCSGGSPTRSSRPRGRPATTSWRTSSTACPSTSSPRP